MRTSTRRFFKENLGLAVHYRLTQGHFLKNRVKIQFCDDGIKIAVFFKTENSSTYAENTIYQTLTNDLKKKKVGLAIVTLMS